MTPPTYNHTRSDSPATPCPLCAASFTADPVNHPAHYNATAIQPIDVIEAWKLGFCLGNAVKYIARHEHKGSALEDLKKARWYLDRAISSMEGA